MRSITLTRAQTSTVFIPYRGDGFRLQITASDAVNMPAEVFAHFRRLVDPETGRMTDEFSHVCSAFDLTVYPANEPDPSQFPQYFRTATVDILLPSLQAVEEGWKAINLEVRELVRALNRLDRLVVAETIRHED